MPLLQGPPRNQLVEEALLLATAAVLHSPAARASLLCQPGALASLVAMLRRTCQHATQDQQASSCATLFGALAWWVGGWVGVGAEVHICCYADNFSVDMPAGTAAARRSSWWMPAPWALCCMPCTPC